ncbi:PTS glucose transporter subunit IIA [Sporolactobacillus sp. CPB3-1]|uniref:PTS glucose transporter subunit IIA n=1 Tax=Sporolactobacillus mangiferae TaxID=2940498 RepID=A0ABT0MAL3_9BACL|nr:PTS glucose transporter subunit IIA [Sporolactobacillus mangiferae]MCL1631375.1 PTS glucose transporter subunit IIA [Sporolactobacillus mangiferae]
MRFLKRLFRKNGSDTDQAEPSAADIAAAGDFYMPFKGKVVPITEVPDPVFSKKMMGDGFAIIPESNILRSPIDGRVTNIFPTNHAITLKASDGRELLIHVGLETVSLKGAGFAPLVREGAEVKKGDRLLQVDFASISSKIPSTITPVVFTNLSDTEYVVVEDGKVSIHS